MYDSATDFSMPLRFRSFGSINLVSSLRRYLRLPRLLSIVGFPLMLLVEKMIANGQFTCLKTRGIYL
ncbi:hypothetical protein FRC09_011230, partial [Ceratobasidium sp. 395]